MTPTQFKAIRKELDLTKPELAKVLGRDLRMVQYYEAGTKDIPAIVNSHQNLSLENKHLRECLADLIDEIDDLFKYEGSIDFDGFWNEFSALKKKSKQSKLVKLLGRV